MARDLNNCSFIGNLTKDPEVRYTASGSAVANFSIACNDDYKDRSGQKVEQVEFINLVAFGKLGEIVAEYLKKGSKVFVSGKFTTSKWQDKEGKDRYSTTVNIKEMQMLDGRAQLTQENIAQTTTETPAAPDDFNDPIPF